MQFLKSTLVLIVLSAPHLTYAEVLPPEEQQKITKPVTGLIEQCDFMKLGTWGFQVFVGMELKDPRVPYIRFNIPHIERAQYETWCKQKSEVTIRYRIKRTKRKLGTTYWAENIKAHKNNPAQ